MPTDRTPLGDEMAETMPTTKIPEPKADKDDLRPPSAQDIARRPGLPDHPIPMPEDEAPAGREEATR